MSFFRSICFALLLVVFIPVNGHALNLDKVFVQIYGGQFVNMALSDFYTENADKMEDAYMTMIGGGIETYIWEDYLGLGFEGNAGVHWGYDDPNFYEFTAAPYLRWYLFPWSDYLETFVTVGNGVSYITRHAQYERDHGSTTNKDMESRTLNYFFMELGAGITDNVDLFYRLHHRCSCWGHVGFDNGGGSNFHTLGLRYSF